MARRPTLRILVAMCLALLAVGVIAGPAAAERVLVACNGTCGYYEVNDQQVGQQGALCKYETVSYDLDSVSVRPPLMHGNYANKTPVRWRFKIRRQSLAPGALFKVYYTSSWQTAQADDAVPAYAGHGFSRRSWYAPENPTGRWQVLVEMQWLHNGSVEGRARVQYEWYKALWSGNSYTDNEYCLQDY